MQEASLKLTNGVNQTFADAGLSASDDEVSDIVNLLLSVFVSCQAVTSLTYGCADRNFDDRWYRFKRDAQFALQEADNDILAILFRFS